MSPLHDVCWRSHVGAWTAARCTAAHRRLSRSEPMRTEEGSYLAHREGNPFLGLLPGEHAHFGVRGEHRRLHGDSVRVRRDIVWQDEYRRLAVAHEVACHGENKVGV